MSNSTLAIANSIRAGLMGPGQAATVDGIGTAGNQDVVNPLGLVSTSADIDVQSAAVVTLTAEATTELTLTNLPSGKAWEVSFVITDADAIADMDNLFTNPVAWPLADSSTSALFSGIDGITVGTELRLLIKSFGGATIYGYVV